MQRTHSIVVVTWAAAMLASASVAAALEPARGAEGNARIVVAELALERGACREAADIYVKAARRSRDIEVAHRATDVAMGCAQLPAAWEAAQRWRSLDPENVDTLRAVGLIAIELWNLDAARSTFTALLGKPDVEADRALADLLPPLTGGEHAAAAWQTFGRIVRRDAVAPETLLALAQLAVAADDFAAARELLVALRARQPASAAADRLTAQIAASAGDAAAALAAAREAAQLEPAEYAFAPAETLVDLDRSEAAHDELESLLQDEELHPEADRRLALLALGSGDFDAARRRFGARLQSGQNTAEALFYLAVIAERRGDRDLALQGYRRLIEAGAGLVPRARAAALLIDSGKRDEGLAILDEFAVKQRDAAIEVAVARAQLLANAGQVPDALKSIAASLEAYPGHPDLQYQHAMLLDRAGRTRESVRAFEALLKSRPDDATVLNALGYTLADRNLQLPRAEQLIRRALTARPDNAPFLDSLGWVRFRRGDATGAVPLLERAWRLSQDAEIAAHWGEVLWESGAQGEARTVWARALTRSPDSRPLRAVLERYTARH